LNGNERRHSDSVGPGEAKLVASALAAKLEQKKLDEKFPFRTKAQREIESLQKKKAYPYSLIKIQLPLSHNPRNLDTDIPTASAMISASRKKGKRLLWVQAKFHPKESVEQMANVLLSSFDVKKRDLMEDLEFELFQSPPRRRFLQFTARFDERREIFVAHLKERTNEMKDKTIHELKLLPAALLFLSIKRIKNFDSSTAKDNNVDLGEVMDFRELFLPGLSTISPQDASVLSESLYPVGKEIADNKKKSDSMNSTSGTSTFSQVTSTSSSSTSQKGTGSKKGGKPSWFKL